MDNKDTDPVADMVADMTAVATYDDSINDNNDSHLVKHAESELRKAGFFDDDSDYNGMLAPAVMELVKVFARQGHSGCSAMTVIQLFNKVASFKILTPITSDQSEWMEVGHNVWQSKRQPSIFSNDGGKTWYDLDEKRNG